MNPAAHDDELRCACGSLLARLLSGDLELRCRRCKRRIVLTPPRPGTRDRAGWARVLDGHARKFTLSAEDRTLLLEHLAPPAR